MIATPIHPKILIVAKKSKWELENLRYGSEEFVKKIYSRQNNSYPRLLDSHKRQDQNLCLLKKGLSQATMAFSSDLPYIDFDAFDLVVSFGGDNHFLHISHFVEDLPMLGVNSDPKKSTGAMLYFDTMQSLSFLRELAAFSEALAGRLSIDSLEIEGWTRISCIIDYPDIRPPMQTIPSTCEISIANQFSNHVSRFFVRKNKDKWHEIRCSGYLLSTGAGSTGWYKNCFLYNADAYLDRPQIDHSFAKNAREFRGVAREPYLPQVTAEYKKNSIPKIFHPRIIAQDSLEIISTIDAQICIDSDHNYVYDFPPGARAKFELSPLKLNVIKNTPPTNNTLLDLN